jgi:hypothetical protein
MKKTSGYAIAQKRRSKRIRAMKEIQAEQEMRDLSNRRSIDYEIESKQFGMHVHTFHRVKNQL